MSAKEKFPRPLETSRRGVIYPRAPTWFNQQMKSRPNEFGRRMVLLKGKTAGGYLRFEPARQVSAIGSNLTFQSGGRRALVAMAFRHMGRAPTTRHQPANKESSTSA